MKIIHKSILKELVFTFIISLAFLNIVLMMEKLLRFSRFLSGVGASLADMLTIIIYIQPQLLLLTIPMAFLLSTLLTYGRHSLDNELVILRTSGMDFRGISKPVFILGILCFLLNIAVSFYIGPKSSIGLRDEITRIIKNRTPLAIEEGSFNTSFKDIVIMIREKPSEGTVSGIFIYDGRNKNEPRVMVAREGKISMSDGFDANLYLKDGFIHIAKGNSTTEIFFKGYNLILTLESDLPSRKNAELTPIELLKKINENASGAMKLQLEFDRRMTLPFMCIVLIVLGPPLSLMTGKSGRLGGLALGLGVFSSYYMLLIYGENLVRAGKIPHYVGAWAPAIILGIFALWTYKRESNK
jgi:lipopolysaccharide export system permease protein